MKFVSRDVDLTIFLPCDCFFSVREQNLLEIQFQVAEEEKDNKGEKERKKEKKLWRAKPKQLDS